MASPCWVSEPDSRPDGGCQHRQWIGITGDSRSARDRNPGLLRPGQARRELVQVARRVEQQPLARIIRFRERRLRVGDRVRPVSRRDHEDGVGRRIHHWPERMWLDRVHHHEHVVDAQPGQQGRASRRR